MDPHSRPHLLAGLLAASLLVLAGTAQGSLHLPADAGLPAVAEPERLAQRDVAGTAPQPTDVNSVRPGQALSISVPGEGPRRCTASFLFRDGASPANHYIGTAGHCVLPSWAVATHGTGANYSPSGVTVSACVSNCLAGGLSGITSVMVTLGPVAYARQTRAAPLPGCAPGDVGNDFALVRLPPSLLPGGVKTTMAVWQGPYGSNSNEGTGNLLVQHGDGTPKAGVSVDDGIPCSFQAVLPSGSADAGSPVSFGGSTHNAPLGGEAALGTLTHSFGGGVAFGTTILGSVQMVGADLGMAISLCDATSPAC